MDKYRKWRTSHLQKKLNKLREEFSWAYDNRELLGADFELFTDIVAEEIMCKKRTLFKLQRKDKQNG